MPQNLASDASSSLAHRRRFPVQATGTVMHYHRPGKAFAARRYSPAATVITGRCTRYFW